MANSKSKAGDGGELRPDLGQHQQTVTVLLNSAAAGEGLAASELLPIVYDELRALATQCFRDQKPGNTLQPTALIHEAYVKLVDQSIEWQSRRQFFAVASTAMRSILVDHARQKNALKRGGGGRKRVPSNRPTRRPSPSTSRPSSTSTKPCPASRSLMRARQNLSSFVSLPA